MFFIKDNKNAKKTGNSPDGNVIVLNEQRENRWQEHQDFRF
jgi:hypothetical protein